MGVLCDNPRIGASAAGTYEIDRSLRFNSGDTTKLERTIQSGGSTTTWTFSVWIKKTSFGATKPICGYYSADTNSQHPMRFNSSDQLEWYNYSSGYQGRLVTNRKFRDSNAWYHLVFVWDTTNGTAGDRMKIYVNGVEETSFATDANPSSSQASHWNTNVLHAIGTTSNYNDGWFDGYMTEINFIDNAVKSASDFGKTDPITGAWIPKKYGGSYGTTGFYLNFSDNSNTTSGTLGADGAGSNDWTPTNFSVSAGVGNDSLLDTPTNNYCTLNPLCGGSTSFSNGALNTSMAAINGCAVSSFAFDSGKWYAEYVITSIVGYAVMGIAAPHSKGWNVTQESNAQCVVWAHGTGTIYDLGDWTHASGTLSGHTFTNNDVIGLALNMDDKELTVYKNNTNTGTITFTHSTDSVCFMMGMSHGSSAGTGYANFGQRPFNTSSTEPPTGYKAPCAANLPEPTIIKPTDYFNTVTYEGEVTDTSTQTVPGVGFQADLTWIKRLGSNSHQLVNSLRGGGKWTEIGVDSDASPPTENASNTNGVLTSWNSDGFVLTGGSTNANLCCEDNLNYVAWNWKESASAGIDFVVDEGTGVDKDVNHDLNVKPEMMFRKCLGRTDNWVVYHKDMDGADATEYLEWNDDDGQQNYHEIWNDDPPDGNHFTVGSDTAVNDDGSQHLTLLFDSVEGFSKVGMYKANNSDNGVFVYTGFAPAWIMIKNRDTNGTWNIFDNKRETYNPREKNLRADTNADEDSARYIDFLSNGFKLRSHGTEMNDPDGAEYLYLAFAETSFKYTTAR